MTASFTLTGHDVTHVTEALIASDTATEEELVFSSMAIARSATSTHAAKACS